MSCVMRTILRLYCFGALAVFSAVLFAQPLVTELPPEYEEPIDVWITDVEKNTSAFYKGRFSDELIAQQIAHGQIFTVASEMIALFDARDWGDNEFRQQKILNRLQRFRASIRVALNTQGIEGPLDKLVEQNIFLQSLNQQNSGLESLKSEPVSDANGNDVEGYFAGTEDELALYEYHEDGEQIRLLLTPEQVREWRLLENALTSLVNEQVLLIRESNVRALENAVDKWENFLDKGYSQMPWESVINGWFIDAPGFPELGPPDHQILFMHPTLGFELSTDSLDETRVKEVLHIELLGHIWYRGQQLEKFSGFSVSASLREDLDPGIGLMVHIKRNWSIGVAWHDVDEDPFLFFSVDLFRFAKQRKMQYVEKYETLRARLEEN